MAKDSALQGAGIVAQPGEPGKALHLLHMLLLLLLLLLLLCRLGCGRPLRLLFGLGRAEVRVLDHLVDVHAVVLAVSQAPPDEVLRLEGDRRLRGEVGVGSLQDDVLLQDGRLALVVPERLKRKRSI